jgi:hypothetical protein
LPYREVGQRSHLVKYTSNLLHNPSSK